MGHNPGRSKIEKWEREKRAREQAERDRLWAIVERRGKRLVALWNARATKDKAPQFYPTIRVAIRAGHPWLNFMCPACKVCHRVDLRKLDYDGRAPICAVIPKLRCQRCHNPPFAVLGTLDRDERDDAVGRVPACQIHARLKR